MKKIVDYKTLEESGLPTVKKRIIGTNLNKLTALYNITSIESIGAIYCLEREEELSDFKSFGMYEPISSDNIEFVDKIFLSENRQEFSMILACFLISADYSIYLIADKNILSDSHLKSFNQAHLIFEKYLED